ncbi:hypothetical protein [Pararhodospirillum oryzae]|uniref:Uncharacterized protein n=1 Tax=Pararhodospirillum oryzae TaxID=478448 RepID=A0A512HB88_9PROT|nr:hypothetical protein [Pararhodospirillum oryzae]GEO82709.1 hypothetical protein ROR02_28400 [Pararhodospirillum oryzae]
MAHFLLSGSRRRGSVTLRARLVAVAGLAALGLATVVGTPGQAAANCTLSKDDAALSVRTLQSHLMVAALSCGQSAQYNQFVGNFQKDLTTQGKSLTSYFSRQYGGAAKREMNAYVTRMANQASQRSMTDRQAYCTESRAVFEALGQVPDGKLVEFVSASLPFAMQPASCQTHTARK